MFPENKLHKIFPVLKECIVCPRTNRNEETVMARLHIGHSFITHSFLLKGEEPPVCIGCDKRFTIEHILLTCSDFIETRESHFTAKFEIIFSYVCVIHLLSMVLKLYIPILRRTYY